MSLFHGKFNSDYCKAYSLGKYITVFVENEDDVPFWSRVLKKSLPHLRFRVFPASRGGLERGKTVLLNYSDGLGDFMLVCLDSDYDYLLQDTTAVSRLINTNPYILQTYTYSIENYKCFATSLGELCVQATLNDEPVFDFVEFFQRYSQVVYDLFLWSFHFRKIGDPTTFVSNDQSSFFGISGQVSIAHNAENVLQNLQAKIEEKIVSLQSSHPSINLGNIAEDLFQLGLKRENTYLFIKGHVVYQNVALILLKRVEKILRTKKQLEFTKNSSGNQEALLQKQREYDNQVLDIETLLAANIEYDSCFLMKCIQDDINKYVTVSSTGRSDTILSDEDSSLC